MSINRKVFSERTGTGVTANYHLSYFDEKTREFKEVTMTRGETKQMVADLEELLLLEVFEDW